MSRRKLGAIGAGIAAASAIGVALAPAATGASIPDLARRALNADRVGGIQASRTAKPNQLLALNRRGELPAAVVAAGPVKGRTVTGVVGTTWLSSGAPNADDTLSDWSGSTITLPFRASVGLGVDDVGVSAGGVELPDCTGSFDNPTAPAGKLCVYPGREVDEAANVFFDDAEVANIAKNGEGAFEAYARPIGGGRYGVRIEAKAAAAGVAKFYATWAYTAP